MKTSLFLTFLLFTLSASAAGNSVHEACKNLCSTLSDCVRKCVAHAELMEVRASLVNTAANFHKDPETRMVALRSGANAETFDLCGKTGWSTENKLICLRSYPTPELMKSCKKLSPLEEDQVRCVRNGKTAAEVEKCADTLLDTSMRLECLGLEVTAHEITDCGNIKAGSAQRLSCLRQADARKPNGKHRRNRKPASR